MWAEAMEHWGNVITELDAMSAILRPIGAGAVIDEMLHGFTDMSIAVSFGCPLEVLTEFNVRRAAARAAKDSAGA